VFEHERAAAQHLLLQRPRGLRRFGAARDSRRGHHPAPDSEDGE
jgi:hypothetical protein